MNGIIEKQIVENVPLGIDQRLCKGCGICYTICPKKAISGDEKGIVFLIDPELCSRCGTCESHCPDYAIFVRRGEKNDWQKSKINSR